MSKILLKVHEFMSYGFVMFLTVFYYLSIRKCFFKPGQCKRRTMLLTLIFSPFVLVLLSLIPLYVIFLYLQGVSLIVKQWETLFNGITMMISTLIYIGLIFLTSALIGKRLGAANRQLVTFVTLMFSVLLSLSMKFEVDENAPPGAYAIEILNDLLLFIACVLLYHFVIRELAKLNDRPRQINTRLFVLPPVLFTLFYNVFSLVPSSFSDDNGAVLVNLFSSIIVLLFIWAFSVIIININATNEAIEAKDLAAEMAKAEARIEADLSIAKNIQISALPSVFPPFPERKEFELFASMNAAKEVGGDFYDFYMLNDSTLGFLIADVSGKSIPGAMFMMTSKTLIKSLAESGLPPAEVFTIANEKLCENNDAEMFVTAWLGYLDLKTGLVRVANAGHNPPVLIRNGKAEYVILKPALMLAGMDSIRYKEQTIQLEKGDILYLYTDGVTEAMDINEKLYGNDRLLKILSFGEQYPEPAENGTVETVCKSVSADLAEYSEGAEQSDDITMLCIRYLGGD